MAKKAKERKLKNGGVRIGKSFFGKQKKSGLFSTREIKSGRNKGASSLWF